MFNEGSSSCTGGNVPSAPLRSMEQMRNYNCNPSPFLNGSPFDLGSQVKKKYSFHFIVFQLSANKSVLNSIFFSAPLLGAVDVCVAPQARNFTFVIIDF